MYDQTISERWLLPTTHSETLYSGSDNTHALRCTNHGKDFHANDLNNGKWFAQRQTFVLIFCRYKKILSAQPAAEPGQAAAGLKRHGFSIHSCSSNGMFAPHRSSNSRNALSDSYRLHMILQVRVFFSGQIFLYVFSRSSCLKFAFPCSALIFCVFINGLPSSSVEDCLG